MEQRGYRTEVDGLDSPAPASEPSPSERSTWLKSFETFTRPLPGAWWVKSSAGVYLFANRSTEAILGAPPGGALGKTDFDFLPRAVAETLRSHDEHVLRTGQSLEVIEQIENGEGRIQSWLSAKFPLQAAEEACAAGFAMDITKVASEKRDADGMLQQILDAITDMIVVKGSHSRLEWANKAFLSVYGMTNAQLKGIIDAPFSEPDMTQQYVRDDLQVFTTGRSLEIPEEPMIRHDGKVLTCHTVKSPIFDSRGKIIKTVAVIRDTTERKRLELELRHSQKLESVGRLSSGIAHEINTPIQFVSDEAHFVRGALKTLLPLCEQYRALVVKCERGGVSPDDIAAIHRAEERAKLGFVLDNIPPALDAILEGTRRVATLVQSMREFANPDAGEREFADINRALETTLTICANETKYVADVEMNLGVLPPVCCYVNELNQVFVNLLVNAAQAIGDRVKGTKQRGKITIITRHVPDGSISDPTTTGDPAVGDPAIGDHVIVSITDTGTGISDAIRPKIFEPFFTTKEVGQGTGQGLALARLIVVDKHQGSLAFETEVGSGTTFSVKLPVKAP
jgi:two-component system NtrC family sensor kinase